MSVTTHVLDTARGAPAPGVPLEFFRATAGGGWTELGSAVTDGDGRAGGLPRVPDAGTYRIRFDVGAYFARTGTEAFYPYVDVVFEIARPDEHHHVPLLLSPFGYSTYRGS